MCCGRKAAAVFLRRLFFAFLFFFFLSAISLKRISGVYGSALHVPAGTRGLLRGDNIKYIISDRIFSLSGCNFPAVNVVIHSDVPLSGKQRTSCRRFAAVLPVW